MRAQRLCQPFNAHGDVLISCFRLKLHLYRSLGISAEQDPSTGEFNRAIVRKLPIADGGDGLGASKGDVNVIKVDGKLDRAFYTGMFWDAL